MKGEKPSPEPKPDGLRELNELVAKAKAGDASVLPRIRAILDEKPEVWQTVGDLAKFVESGWIDRIARDAPLVRESVQRKAAAYRDELSGPHATTAEKMIVDLVVNNWLAVQLVAYRDAGDQEAGASVMQAQLRLKQSESAQKKFLNALRMLATMRAHMPQGLAPADSLRIFTGEQKKDAA